MPTIIPISEAQKTISTLPKQLKTDYCIVTKNGKGSMIILPYFKGCERSVEDLLEDYEMYLNKEKLQKEFREASEAGPSDLVI